MAEACLEAVAEVGDQAEGKDRLEEASVAEEEGDGYLNRFIGIRRFSRKSLYFFINIRLQKF